MTTQQIIDTVNILLDGRKIVGGAYIPADKSDGPFAVRALVRNSDGIGRRDMLLCSVDSAEAAVAVKRAFTK